MELNVFPGYIFSLAAIPTWFIGLEKVSLLSFHHFFAYSLSTNFAFRKIANFDYPASLASIRYNVYI